VERSKSHAEKAACTPTGPANSGEPSDADGVDEAFDLIFVKRFQKSARRDRRAVERMPTSCNGPDTLTVTAGPSLRRPSRGLRPALRRQSADAAGRRPHRHRPSASRPSGLGCSGAARPFCPAAFPLPFGVGIQYSVGSQRTHHAGIGMWWKCHSARTAHRALPTSLWLSQPLSGCGGAVWMPVRSGWSRSTPVPAAQPAAPTSACRAAPSRPTPPRSHS
jgi:hypothetical protein